MGHLEISGPGAKEIEDFIRQAEPTIKNVDDVLSMIRNSPPENYERLTNLQHETVEDIIVLLGSLGSLPNKIAALKMLCVVTFAMAIANNAITKPKVDILDNIP